jgi:predicted PurR-regulated permease PerM
MIVFIICVTLIALSKIGFVLRPVAIIVESIFLPILLAGVCFYLFNPVIDFLEKKGLKRVISILVLYLVLIGIIAGIIAAVIPPLKSQIQSFVHNIPQLTHEVENMAKTITQSEPFEKVKSTLQSEFSKLGKKTSSNVSQYISHFSHGVVSVVGTITEIVLAIAMLPILLFYLLKDGKKLPPYIIKFLPDRSRDEARTILHDMNHGLSSYIRGQILVAIFVGVLLFIGYLIIGLDYALLLAVIAMVTNVVPYLGPIIAISPAIILAIVHSPAMLLKLAIVWCIVQLLESFRNLSSTRCAKFPSPIIAAPCFKDAMEPLIDLNNHQPNIQSNPIPITLAIMRITVKRRVKLVR